MHQYDMAMEIPGPFSWCRPDLTVYNCEPWNTLEHHKNLMLVTSPLNHMKKKLNHTFSSTKIGGAYAQWQCDVASDHCGKAKDWEEHLGFTQSIDGRNPVQL